MAGAASQAGGADSSQAPGLTSGLKGSVNVHRGTLLFVQQWQCISSFVFYIDEEWILFAATFSPKGNGTCTQNNSFLSRVSKSSVPFTCKFAMVMHFVLILPKWYGSRNNFYVLVTPNLVDNSVKVSDFSSQYSRRNSWKNISYLNMWKGEYQQACISHVILTWFCGEKEFERIKAILNAWCHWHILLSI